MNRTILLVDIGMEDWLYELQDGGGVRIVFSEEEGKLMGMILVDGIYFDGCVVKFVAESIDFHHFVDVWVGESKFIYVL